MNRSRKLTKREFLKNAGVVTATAATTTLAAPYVKAQNAPITWRLQTYAGPALADHVIKNSIEWFNKAAFEFPDQYTFGTAGAYITDADGIISFDVAVQKDFRINERHAIEFRAEFFNLPNNVNFGLPQEAMNNGNFGIISGQSTNPRQIQFGLRYHF